MNFISLSYIWTFVHAYDHFFCAPFKFHVHFKYFDTFSFISWLHWKISTSFPYHKLKDIYSLRITYTFMCYLNLITCKLFIFVFYSTNFGIRFCTTSFHLLYISYIWTNYLPHSKLPSFFWRMKMKLALSINSMSRCLKI